MSPPRVAWLMRRCWIVGTDGLGEADMASNDTRARARSPRRGARAPDAQPRRTDRRRSHAEQLAAAYRNHRLDLYRFAQRRLGDPALAEEMSTPQRQAVVQVHLRDRPYDVVAAELGVPVGTLKSRIHVGLRTARKEGSSRRRIRPSGPT